jgi:tetratricopeptide (TPR) repeat protein
VVASLAATLLAVLTAGVVAATLFAVKAREEADKAHKSFEEATRRADAEQKVRRSFKTLLLALRDTEPLYFLGGYGTAGTVTAEANPLVRTLIARFPELLHDPPGDMVARAALHDTIGDFYRTYGDFKKAEPLLEEALKLRQLHLGEQHPDYAASLHSLACLYHDRGDYARAEDLYRKALASRQRLNDAEGIDASMFNLARMLLEMGDYGPAEQLLLAVIKARQSRDGDVSRPVAVTKFALAALYLDRGQPEMGWMRSRDAVNTFIAIEGDKGLWRAVALCQEAMVNAELPPLLQGDPGRKFKESLSLISSSVGENHAYNAIVLHELARYLGHARRSFQSIGAKDRPSRLPAEILRVTSSAPGWISA